MIRTKICVSLLLGILGGLALGGCGGWHFAKGTVTIRKTTLPAEVPQPEIVAAKTYWEKRGSYKRVTIYFVERQSSTLQKKTGAEFLDKPAVREIEKTFIRSGYEVLEVRQLTAVELEKEMNRAKQDEIAKTGDFIVFVYAFDYQPRKFGKVEVNASTHFYYGNESDDIKSEMSPEAIDAKVGFQTAMKPVVTQTKSLATGISSPVSTVQAAFLEAKVVDAKTREVVFFYKAYTLNDADVVKKEKVETEYRHTPIHYFEKQKGRFIRYDKEYWEGTSAPEDQPKESSGYGDLSARTSVSAKTITVKDAGLQRLAKAGERFIKTFKTHSK